jgi:hypothetical protein
MVRNMILPIRIVQPIVFAVAELIVARGHSAAARDLVADRAQLLLTEPMTINEDEVHPGRASAVILNGYPLILNVRRLTAGKVVTEVAADNLGLADAVQPDARGAKSTVEACQGS